MLGINHLDGSDFFDTDCIPVRVMVAEHRTNCTSYHTHSFYEFVYIDHGFSTHFYNHTTTLLTPGDIFGMRPGDIHGYICPRNTILYNCLFNHEVLENEMTVILKLPGVGQILDPSTPPIWQRLHLDPISQKEVVACLEKMRREGEERRIGWETKLKGLLMEFLVLFSRAYQNNYTKNYTGDYKYTQYMYSALSFIEEHYTKGILVEDIASFIGLSTDYFSRMFKQFTGLTPVEYIKNVRLAKAADLLRQPGISVARVAMEVGFEDPGYFARQFKQVLGISPSRFQRENNVMQMKGQSCI